MYDGQFLCKDGVEFGLTESVDCKSPAIRIIQPGYFATLEGVANALQKQIKEDTADASPFDKQGIHVDLYSFLPKYISVEGCTAEIWSAESSLYRTLNYSELERLVRLIGKRLKPIMRDAEKHCKKR